MYFDAVLTDDLEPVFNGTPEEVKAWLEKDGFDERLQICEGRTLRMMSLDEYLGRK